MAKVKFSRKEFEKHIKITNEIEEKIALFGTPLESLTKEEVEIEIFPNRPDLLSSQGYLRGFLAFLGKKKGLKNYKINKPEKNFEVKIDKSVKNIRPYTACAIIKNLKFDDEKIKEVIDIQEKLHVTIGRNRKKIAIGIYPLEKIKLPIRFEARAPKEIKFMPLESQKEMNGLQILREHPAGRDYSSLLQGMPKFPVFIDGNNEILSMPPIINSHKTGKITQNTKEIFIECSGFDLEILKKTLNILVTMFADMNGDVYQMKLKYDKQEITPELEPEKMKIRLENVNKLLGLDLKEKDIKPLLEKMGYDYKNSIVSIPAWRTDIMHEVDIIEDIAIAYGYEKFVPEIPEISTVGEEDKKESLKRKLAEILIGQNMLQISSYHLITKEDLKKLGIKPEIEVEASKTDYSVLRPNLVCQSLKILSENVDKEYPQKIFEIGPVFNLDNKEETGVKESERLCISLVPGNFTEAKQILEYLGRMLNTDLKIESAEHPILIPGRTGRITYTGRTIGFIGELHPNMLKKLHLKFPVVIIEISLEEILKDKLK
jgi:phenylalanyl-tRNA synthetase beta chain